MGSILSKPSLLRTAIAACALLFGGGAALAQTATVQLTASPQTATLPDGQSVPMWGYTCGDALATPVPATGGATCTAANGAPQSGAAWQPPLITVPANTVLSITLVNQLSFPTSGVTVPTSLVIVGQVGGGLGTDRATMPSPVHAPQGTTWPGSGGGVDPATAAISVSGGGAGYTVPPNVTLSGGGGSGASAIAIIANGMVTGVNVTSVGSGYTSTPSVTIDPPPCTLNGTTCIQATATMNLAVLQGSDGSPTFVPPAQADRVRSFATEVNVSDSGGKVLTWSKLRPGTYLIHSGTQPSIQHPMGLYGVLVVTDPASTPSTPSAWGTSFDKDVALLLSEIDPDQNRAVDTAVRTTGFSDALVWDAQTGKCGDPAVHTCYPPAVNYSPLYYLINGVAFDRTRNPLDNTVSPAVAGPSVMAVPSSGPQGRLLLRFVNAGLRLHVPSVVNKNMTLLAEDGNKVPGTPRVQASVALAAGKTFDVTVQPAQTTAGTYDDATLAVFDRQLSLSTSNQRDGGMQAYLVIGKGAASGTASSSTSSSTLSASDKTYYCASGNTLAITDPSMGLLGGSSGASGVAVTGMSGDLSASTLAVNSNGTFTYRPTPGTSCGGSFTFSVNGKTSNTATIAQCDAYNSSASGCSLAAAPTAGNLQFVSNIATRYASPPPGVFAGVTNPGGLALTATKAVADPVPPAAPLPYTINPDGSFTADGTQATSAACGGASPAAPAGSTCLVFPYKVANTQGSASSAQVTVVFLAPSNLVVNVWDAPSTAPGQTPVAVSDYRWIIEEDRTFWIDPKCQVNSTDPALRPTSCPPLPVESLGYSFHTASMPVVAQGCVGKVSCESGQTINNGTPTACDIGNGVCPTDGSKSVKAQTLPGSVHLDPSKRYFISVLPGDAVNPTIGGAGGPDAQGNPFSIATACGPYTGPSGAWEPGGAAAMCGHGMGGAAIAAGQSAVDIRVQETPLPTAKIAVFVFEDDNPLNGENDAGGGVDVIAPNEPGLGDFQIVLLDQAGGLGDATGQITYDMFNQPVSNSLANKIDPITGLDSCPINPRGDGLVGMITVCPKFESDGVTPSPLAGQAVIANLYPGIYEVQAFPGADRVARGEEWLQTNTLDGGKPHEAFIKPNEPGYFQEFGPGGFHVSIGFANPAIINARKTGYCATQGAAPYNNPCVNSLTVQVTNNHMSRSPDQRTYSSESYDHYGFTQCYVSIGPADAEDFAFQKCNPDGTVNFANMPAGVFKITVFDQWNDIMLDGLVGTVSINAGIPNTKVFPVTQWRTNLFTRTFIDDPTHHNPGVSTGTEPGLALVNTNIHYRDGSVGFYNNTDLNGYAGFNEVFPFMNWLVVETSSTRFKPTGVHTVYDAGGPVDCSAQSAWVPPGDPRCGNGYLADHLANTDVRAPLPADLRIPGAKYCDNADCPAGDAGTGKSTGVVFPPQPWGTTQAWQGLLGQNSFMEFGLKPFMVGETGGISGMVVYASTRPFDDPSLSLQLQWEPGVARVKINLYSKTVDASGNEVLKLVDTTTTASWDDWAQGFRRDADGNLITAGSGANLGYVPNISCPGQPNDSPFFATLKNSKQWLDPDRKQLAYQSQFKCYDGWSQLNQIQPAPYDGLYRFPSVTGVDPATGKPIHPTTHKLLTNCSICVPNPDDGTAMLPAGKYVVEVILPPGYELVKEEDKNILLGDVYIAPVTQQFAGFGNIFILPDQAAVNAAYNANNPGGLDKTTNLGSITFPRHEGDTGSIEAYWPCVGAERIVPDLMSLYPGAGQASPFAGAKRRLCDRKEVALDDQSSALVKFYIFSSAHIAGHFTGTITNDFAAEFDPFSPQFGEKFGPPNLPVAMRDFTGNEVYRVYADQWGIYNGLYFSSWEVNPPNPTGFAPQMAIACMNDPGPVQLGTDAQGKPIMGTDPNYNPAYSNFCYETPFMPGFTAYMDTPVIPTQAFADGYNLPDSEYPDNTPAIMTVVNSEAAQPQGPYVVPPTPATAASATITFANVSAGDSVVSVKVGSTTLTGGTITCNTLTICSQVLNPTGRNFRMATLVAQSIAARAGTTGITATATGDTVTLTATATGTALNGQAVVVTQAGITVTGTLAFAGGAVAAPGHMGITITALGDKVVQNPAFSGPNATTSPYNLKTITRHYGFGTSTGTAVLIAPDGTTAPLAIGSWSNQAISATVPSNLPSAFNCAVQQRGAPQAKCGQLVITRADNGKQSIDAITVTVGGNAPWMVSESGVTAPSGKSVKDYGKNFGRMGISPIQVALDSADPGDLVLVTPGSYRENLIMWKPVRLQGVGAAAVTINADAHPAGKMDQWRRQVNCAFGLTLDGVPNPDNANYQGTDPTNAAYTCPNEMHQRVDRIPFEAIIGWDASGNGNLAQVLQEPTLMGAYEGAGVTVLGRGVRIPANSIDFWGQQATGGAGAFTDGSVWLTNNNADCTPSAGATDGRDYGTSNYLCNPSRIDGVSVINSSQGGGGVFIHGWAHNLEVANTRVSGNHGTLAGAINLGNGETPDAFLNDGVECNVNPVVVPCPPVSWNGYTPASGGAIAFQFNTKVRIHHNMLYNNASIGDALFSGTPAGAGAITVSAGADGYQIDHNWIAGNLSTGDGGGVQHLGLSFQGRIDHNVVLYNQSTNPTLPTNGGGIVIEGANLDRQLNGNECGSTNDQDCPPGLGEGTGFGTVLDANLIIGNSAEMGSGGGVRLQQVNGSELIAFPRNASTQWYDVTMTNNVIANNVAGWDGGGVSLQDALRVTIVNNTIASNDTTASSGVLFKTLAAIDSASPPPGCTPTTDPSLPQNPNCTGADAPHGPQPSGLVVQGHTPNLIAEIAALAAAQQPTCPAGFGYSGTDCRNLSKPRMANDLFWQNRTFRVEVVQPDGTIVNGTSTPTGTGLQSQQNLVALFPGTSNTRLPAQQFTGDCPAGASYWDVGLRTDDIASGVIPAGTKVTLTNSLYTADTQNVITGSANRVGGSGPLVAPLCNGARMPPEHCTDAGVDQGSPACKGFNAPPGASETTGLTTVFVFNGIQPTATVDEGHNWLNLNYGPLTLGRPNVSTPTAAEQMVVRSTTGTANGAYSIPTTSSAIAGGSTSTGVTQVANDFFGTLRGAGRNDIGAVQLVLTGSNALVAPAAVPFGSQIVNTTSAAQTLSVVAGSSALNGLNVVVTAPFARSGGTCTTTLAANATCTILVTFRPTGTGPFSGTATITTTNGVTVANSPVQLSGTGIPATFLATVSPATLDFGNWASGTTSATLNLTVTNTGNSDLSTLTFTLGGGSPMPYARITTGTFPAGAPNCGTTLTVGSSCTVKLQFTAPTTGATTFPRTLTIAGANSPTITPNPVPINGTRVAARATVSLSAPAIVLPTGTLTGTGLVTLTNTAPAGGSQVNTTNVTVSGGSALTYFFSVGAAAGPNNCTGVPLAPGASCTVTVRFTNTGAARGVNRSGSITFTDTGAASPQTATLTGFATP